MADIRSADGGEGIFYTKFHAGGVAEIFYYLGETVVIVQRKAGSVKVVHAACKHVKQIHGSVLGIVYKLPEKLHGTVHIACRNCVRQAVAFGIAAVGGEQFNGVNVYAFAVCIGGELVQLVHYHGHISAAAGKKQTCRLVVHGRATF